MVLAFVFAVAYRIMYGRNSRVFAFNADVLRARSRIEKARWETELMSVEKGLTELRELADELISIEGPLSVDAPSNLFDQWSKLVGPTTTFAAVLHAPERMPDGSGRDDAFAELITTGAKEIRIGIGSLPTSIPEFRTILKPAIADSILRKRALEQLFATLDTDTPQVWSYWDFLYFSATTQFTVGYGDILPNASSVRMVVLLQIVIAGGLLAVVINLVFPA